MLTFVLLFFLFAVLFEKGSDEGSILQQILWNLQVYALSSLACFNDYVTTGAQETPGGILIPNVIRDVFRFVGISMPEKPNLLPFAMVPIQCNTYTLLFHLYHDAGFLGVLFGLAAIGWLSTYLWLKQIIAPSPIVLFTYSIALYPLAMSMFEDAYFSSPGFWVMLWTPPIILSVILGLHRKPKLTYRRTGGPKTGLEK
jgi:oligosaccharide repeat unit polymerase